jgi:hypothetical protein
LVHGSIRIGRHPLWCKLKSTGLVAAGGRFSSLWHGDRSALFSAAVPCGLLGLHPAPSCVVAVRDLLPWKRRWITLTRSPKAHESGSPGSQVHAERGDEKSRNSAPCSRLNVATLQFLSVSRLCSHTFLSHPLSLPPALCLGVRLD